MLREQLHVCNCHLIQHIFIPVVHRLGRPQQVFFKSAFFAAKASQWQPCRQCYRTASLHPALLQFFCDSCQRQQVIVFVDRLIPLDRLPPCSAHIPAALVFQHILPGIGFVIVCRNPCGKHTMPCFHCVVAVVDVNNRLVDFSLSLLSSLWKTPLFFPPAGNVPGVGVWGRGRTQCAPVLRGACFKPPVCKRVHFPLGLQPVKK